MPAPSLCVHCGSDRPTDPAAPCPGCTRLPPAGRWTHEPITALEFFKRLWRVLGALLLASFFVLPCVGLSLAWISDSPYARAVQVIVWIVVVPIAALLAVMLPYTAVRDALNTAWRFVSDDPRIRARAATAFGALREADGTINDAEVASAFRGASVSSAEVLRSDLRMVRKALCNQATPRVQWRNIDVLLFAAVAGMVDRDELRLTLNSARWWTRAGVQVTRGEQTPTMAIVRAARTMPPSGWLERRIFDALPTAPTAAPADSDVSSQGPFRAAARVETPTPAGPVALDVCLTQALAGIPTVQRTLVNAVRDDRATRRPLDAATVITALLASLRSDVNAARLVRAAGLLAVRRAERRPV